MSILDIRPVIAGGVAILTTGILASLYFRRPNRGPGPETFPGPKKDFLIGNVRDFPKTHWKDEFMRWKELYGVLGSITRRRTLNQSAFSFLFLI